MSCSVDSVVEDKRHVWCANSRFDYVEIKTIELLIAWIDSDKKSSI